ncbi:MAG: PP2C family protein-serine/threonine phosphatase, partial [Gammaproteobacteria bacterium]
MKISSSALSDRGRQRTENEDAFLTDQELQLYVVCDGMGGHLAGAEASQMATRVVRSEIGKHASTIRKHSQSLEVATRHQVSKVLEEAVAAANAAIFSAAQEDPTKRGMGTT